MTPPEPSIETQTLSPKTDGSAIWLLVLHWQGSHYTRACLASLQALTGINFRILLVDNGSPEKSSMSIAKQFPDIELLELPDNLGFAGGCNAGIKYCIDRGAQWIWLLNNDTRVSPDSLSLLIQAANENPKAAALGATVYTGSGTQFAASGPGEIDFVKAKTYLRKQPANSKAITSCAWLSGSNLFLRTEALIQSGLFDEDYFLYFEDTELCLRLCKMGWQCLLVTNARVEHVGGASTEGQRSYWRAYYYTRNRLLFFGRYLQGVTVIVAFFNIYAHLLRHLLVLPFRGHSGRKQLKAELLGLQDYLTGHFGKANCLDWCDKD